MLDGTSIQLVNSVGEVNDTTVTNEVIKPLSLKFCKIVAKSKGHILEVGFGPGISANYFLELGVKSYTCIENNEEVYKRAIEWSKDKLNVTIILGEWIDVIPTLSFKFDSIFMSTYGDKPSKYGIFEEYAKRIAKEGCTLSLWEYSAYKPFRELNVIKVPIHQNNFKLLLKPFHNICWTYYFGGKFCKEKFYEKKNIISPELCKEIILQNQGEYTLDEQSAIIEGIVHNRKVWIKNLVNNVELFRIIRDEYYPHHEVFNPEDLYFCKIIKYTPGCVHDRHLETIKYTSLLSEEQFADSLIITLNSDYEGGKFKIFDSWIRSDRSISFDTNTIQGDVIKFKPYQHCETEEVRKGIKYEIFIKIKRKELKTKLQFLI